MLSTIRWGKKRGIKRLSGLISVVHLISGTFGIWTQSLNHSAVLFTGWADWPKVPPQPHLQQCPLLTKLYFWHPGSFSAPRTHGMECPSREGFPGPPNLKWKPLSCSILFFSLWTFMDLLVCLYVRALCPPHIYAIPNHPPRSLPFLNRCL